MGLSCGECGLSLKTLPTFQAYSPEMVHSNKIFSPEDIGKSQATIHGIKNAIGDINNYINHISRHLASLRNGRAQLQAALTTHQSVIAPFRRLHPEILGEIFAHCGLVIPLADLASHVPNRGSENRISIGQVCRQWRDVLNFTPHLWSSMRVHDNDMQAEWSNTRGITIDVVTKQLERMLNRSGAHPLTFDVDLRRRERETQGIVEVVQRTSYTKVNQLLTLHAPRWHRVQFSNIPPNFTFPRELPSLEHINIPSYVDGNGIHISSAPKLESVEIIGIGERVYNIALPWENLRRLCLTSVFSGWHQIIRQCTSLQLLGITMARPFRRWDDSINESNPIDTADHPITLPTVRILTFAFANNSVNQDAIWNSLTLPNLYQLTLNSFSLGPPVFGASTFSRLLIRSKCVITSLHISGTIDIQAIQSTLPLLDAVSDFSLEYECQWGSDYSSLTIEHMNISSYDYNDDIKKSIRTQNGVCRDQRDGSTWDPIHICTSMGKSPASTYETYIQRLAKDTTAMYKLTGTRHLNNPYFHWLEWRR